MRKNSIMLKWELNYSCAHATTVYGSKKSQAHQLGIMNKLFLSIFLLFLVPSAASQAETITFLSPEIPGLISSREQGKIVNKGAVDFIHRISTHAGVIDIYKIVPFAQAYQSAEEQNATCAMGIGRDDVNESKFKWVGPVVRQKMLLYANANDKRNIRKLEDARNLVIGVGRKTVVGSKLKGLGFIIEEADNEAINLKKLNAKEIDLWAANAIPAMAAMKQLNIAEPRLVTIIGTIDGYIACNRKISDATIKRLNDAVRSLEKLDEIFKMGS
jgi:polar amino acid transport system substrate-binding protein